MNNVERSDQATPTRRRRRRSRSRAQGKSPANSGHNQSPSKKQTKNQPKGQSKTQQRPHKSGQQKSSPSKSKGHTRSTSRGGAKNSRPNKRRSFQQRRNSGRKGAITHGSVQLPRHTSIETSAGGLVASGLAEAVREDNSVDLSQIYVALIGRLDRRNRLLWSMPKGHVEPGEAFDSTAEREVWEETGIHGEVLVELGVIDYWFVSEGKRIHKTVHHHLLRYVDGDLNDEDPEVTEVTWVPADTLVERLAYADERKLARRAHDLLPDIARAEKQAGRATPR